MIYAQEEPKARVFFFLNYSLLAIIVFNICAYFWTEFLLSHDFSGSPLEYKCVLSTCCPICFWTGPKVDRITTG